MASNAQVFPPFTSAWRSNLKLNELHFYSDFLHLWALKTLYNLYLTFTYRWWRLPCKVPASHREQFWGLVYLPYSGTQDGVKWRGAWTCNTPVAERHLYYTVMHSEPWCTVDLQRYWSPFNQLLSRTRTIRFRNMILLLFFFFPIAPFHIQRQVI